LSETWCGNEKYPWSWVSWYDRSEAQISSRIGESQLSAMTVRKTFRITRPAVRWWCRCSAA
jgi:hypothetical protein